MSHDASVGAPGAPVLTPDRFPLARGQWPHAETWGVTRELRDLRYVLLAYSHAQAVSKRGRQILADDSADYSWHDDDRLSELRELDQTFARWLEAWWEDGFRCSVTPEEATMMALHVEATVQLALGAAYGHQLPAKTAKDLVRTSSIAREAVALAVTRKRAKEIQIQASAGLPLTICGGDHPLEFAGCGRVFSDRTFPDAAGRGPNGRMFRSWCDEHQGGQSRRLRDQAKARFIVTQAELRRVAETCQE